MLTLKETKEKGLSLKSTSILMVAVSLLITAGLLYSPTTDPGNGWQKLPPVLFRGEKHHEGFPF